MRAESLEKRDVREQLVLYVLVQFAVFGDKLIVQVDFPLHRFSMHYDNYAVKCMCWPPARACERKAAAGTAGRSGAREAGHQEEEFPNGISPNRRRKN